MESVGQRIARHRPNPGLAGMLSSLPFLAAVVLAMGMDMVVGPAAGATWSKILSDVGIAIVLAGSLNVVNGYAGQFSIGHAGFMLVGGYAAAWLTFYGSIHWFGTKDTVGAFLGQGQQLFLAGCMLGGVVAAVFGVVVGLPTLRLRGDYLAIVTLGFGEIVRVLGQITARQPKNIEAVSDRSMLELADNLGGAEGFSQIPGYTRLFFIFLFAFILLILTYRLKYSSKGRALLAVRENEIAAEAVGVDTTRAKVVAFVFAAFFAGIGGALYAHQVGAIDPKELGFIKSIDLVIIVVIGGMGSITGIVLGASLLVILPELLREAADWQIWRQLPEVIGDPIIEVLGKFSDYRMIIYALALITVMLLRPQGIMGIKELWETSLWRRGVGAIRASVARVRR
jgi:branched-chain amino acid transport system permease protein